MAVLSLTPTVQTNDPDRSCVSCKYADLLGPAVSSSTLHAAPSSSAMTAAGRNELWEGEGADYIDV